MRGKRILVSSAIVFLIINAVENYIHYNIGRNHGRSKTYKLKTPTMGDFLSMGATMTVFAALQAFGTAYLMRA